jgi:hypothetical protein
VTKDVLTLGQAEKELLTLSEREEVLTAELDRLAAVLADVPDEESLRVYVEKVEGLIFLYDEEGKFGPDPDDPNLYYEGGNTIGTWLRMTSEDKRRLIQAVFDAPLADGTPAGV